MTWVKLDDQFPDHPKIAPLPAASAWMHVCGLCYCARHLTDGVIPKRAAWLLVEAGKRHVKALVESGVWLDRGDDYEIHDYLEWQPSRSEVRAKKAKKAMAGEKGNHARWHGEHPDPECRHCIAEGIAPAIANASQPSSQSYRPSPSPSLTLSKSSSRSRGSAPVDDEDPRVERALGIVADKRTPAGKPGSYRRKVLANLRAEDSMDVEAARLCDEFPGAPAELIAASLLGEDVRNLGMYREAAS